MPAAALPAGRASFASAAAARGPHQRAASVLSARAQRMGSRVTTPCVQHVQKDGQWLCAGDCVVGRRGDGEWRGGKMHVQGGMEEGKPIPKRGTDPRMHLPSSFMCAAGSREGGQQLNLVPAHSLTHQHAVYAQQEAELYQPLQLERDEDEEIVPAGST